VVGRICTKRDYERSKRDPAEEEREKEKFPGRMRKEFVSVRKKKYKTKNFSAEGEGVDLTLQSAREDEGKRRFMSLFYLRAGRG